MVSTLLLPSFLAGVVTHCTYFISGEHHRYAFRYLQASCLLPSLAIVTLVCLGHDAKAATGTTVTAAAAFFSGLYSSVLVYRLLLHPLRKFPGPSAASSSKLWNVYQNLSRIRNFEFLDNLHKGYGDFVRVGTSKPL